ncbi:hypothetical protein [uncultured Gemmiger sp.]|uniref:hypothetical protein n=1 Tax=uncultured Gemmiger sp. TaxID=1623490 RepID=UPI0025CCB5DA|nr:hypothetical protein [uncultured Gemmiger sp.]
MRTKVDFYQVDGVPMLVPDDEPEFSFADLDASDSGRDESGVMHRLMIREKVGTWSFSYSHLSDEDLAYLRGLFVGKVQFTFTHPVFGDSNATETCTAYMSQYSATWKNQRTGQWRNFKFNIIQC